MDDVSSISRWNECLGACVNDKLHGMYLLLYICMYLAAIESSFESDRHA